MAPPTAVNFILLGTALILLGWKSTVPAAQRLAFGAGLCGFLPLMEYLYGTSHAESALITFTSLPAALLSPAGEPGSLPPAAHRGPDAEPAPDTVGGRLSRRLAPFVIGVPILPRMARIPGPNSACSTSRRRRPRHCLCHGPSLPWCGGPPAPSPSGPFPPPHGNPKLRRTTPTLLAPTLPGRRTNPRLRRHHRHHRRHRVRQSRLHRLTGYTAAGSPRKELRACSNPD